MSRSGKPGDVARSAEGLETGRTRALVPFFVGDGAGGMRVNEGLEGVGGGVGEVVEVSVRTWDKGEGVFKHGVHRVRDDASACASRAGGSRTEKGAGTRDKERKCKRLMTVQEIRALRQARRAELARERESLEGEDVDTEASKRDVEEMDKDKSDNTHINHTQQQQQPSPSTSVAQAPAGTPARARRYAGSTFEVASPPPTTFPIPSFARGGKGGGEAGGAPHSWVEMIGMVRNAEREGGI